MQFDYDIYTPKRQCQTCPTVWWCMLCSSLLSLRSLALYYVVTVILSKALTLKSWCMKQTNKLSWKTPKLLPVQKVRLLFSVVELSQKSFHRSSVPWACQHPRQLTLKPCGTCSSDDSDVSNLVICLCILVEQWLLRVKPSTTVPAKHNWDGVGHLVLSNRCSTIRLHWDLFWAMANRLHGWMWELGSQQSNNNNTQGNSKHVSSHKK